MQYRHVPVMLEEVIKYLAPRSGGKYIDCTLGGAAYTMTLAKIAGSKGKVIGIDLDELAIKNANREIKSRGFKNIVLVQDNFKNLAQIVADLKAAKQISGQFDGLCFDLGLSSAQLDDEARGFSFKGDRPLDMAFGRSSAKSTVDIVNRYSMPELAQIFRELGEEKRAGRIAREIVAARKQEKITTTGQLLKIIEAAVPFRFRSRLHPATKVFQALRMETNSELEALSEVLPQALDLLVSGGRLVVVSFHSGEDRIVKRFFKSRTDLEILTKRPLTPTDQETADNPRARSAKLRAAQLI